jgi:hypothetical protein
VTCNHITIVSTIIAVKGGPLTVELWTRKREMWDEDENYVEDKNE